MHLFIFICSLVVILASTNEVNAQVMRSYTNKSVLASGRTVKIRVQEEGIYSFSYDALRKMGFSNPKNVHLRGYGGELLNENFTKENQYIDDLADQPVVDLGNRIVFYLRGVVGFNKSNETSMDNIGLSEHYTSEHSYYFLHEEDTESKKIEYAGLLTENDQKQTTFTSIQWQKFDDINVAKSGRNWVGNKFSDGERKTYTFRFNNLIAGETARIYSNVLSASPNKAKFNLETDLTNTSVTLSAEDKKHYTFGDASTMKAEATQTSSNTISVTYDYDSPSLTAAGYIDFIQVAAKCSLKCSIGYQMIPVSPSSIENTITYAALNSTSNFQIWDVSEINNVKRVPARLSKDSLIFTIKTRPGVGKYIMVDWNGNFPTPEVVGKVDNQNIHALRDIEYVVVTNPEFMDQAKEIAEFHKEVDGMSVAVVTAEQIYNEFSSGTPDPTAIRAFMKMLWDRAAISEYGVFPQYLLLMGDGTYDNLGKLKNTSRNKMLTYQSVKSLSESSSYTSDDYFGYVEDNTFGYDQIYLNKHINIGVGRFPASNVEQATNLVNKVKQYYASEPGDWRTKLVALADDNEDQSLQSEYHVFAEQQETVMDALKEIEPRINYSRIYWDNFTCDESGGSRRYPEVTKAITNKFNEGALVFNYLGHSSYNAISAEHSYSISQVQNIYNSSYPLWFAGSCNLSQFDDFTPCFGEEIILNPNGGAIASIGSVRVAYITQNLHLDKTFLNEIFNPENEYRLGKIWKSAKTALGSEFHKVYYALLGDPGIKLKVPELNLVLDSIIKLKPDGTIVNADTLKALSKVEFICHVEDETGKLLSQFNGTVSAKFEDKEVYAYTKGNDTKDFNPEPFKYKTRQSTLYSGYVTVKDGKFTLQMIVPKDINYKVGYGKLSLYAYDDLNGWDAMGTNYSILIGGSETDIEEDNMGPSIELTTNGKTFKDGYKVNLKPMIYVDLSDKNGINASGSGVGHKITLTIDDNTKNVISLNSYFKYNTGSCTDGRVSYHIEEKLSEGWHTIKIKAWDLYNNSSESTIRIFATEHLTPEIETLTVYPNPVKEDFSVYIKTNRPDEIQTAECFLTDLSGRVLSRKELTDKPANGIWDIKWDLGENGKIAPGLYLMYVRIATKDSDFAEKAEKIVVIAQ